MNAFLCLRDLRWSDGPAALLQTKIAVAIAADKLLRERDEWRLKYKAALRNGGQPVELLPVFGGEEIQWRAVTSNPASHTSGPGGG
jgi:hypothetical protein